MYAVVLEASDEEAIDAHGVWDVTVMPYERAIEYAKRQADSIRPDRVRVFKLVETHNFLGRLDREREKE